MWNPDLSKAARMSYFGMRYECTMSIHCRAIPNTHRNINTESERLGVKQQYPIVRQKSWRAGDALPEAQMPWKTIDDQERQLNLSQEMHIAQRLIVLGTYRKLLHPLAF